MRSGYGKILTNEKWLLRDIDQWEAVIERYWPIRSEHYLARHSEQNTWPSGHWNTRKDIDQWEAIIERYWPMRGGLRDIDQWEASITWNTRRGARGTERHTEHLSSCERLRLEEELEVLFLRIFFLFSLSRSILSLSSVDPPPSLIGSPATWHPFSDFGQIKIFISSSEINVVCSFRRLMPSV